jgi:hypothetical protein
MFGPEMTLKELAKWEGWPKGQAFKEARKLMDAGRLVRRLSLVAPSRSRHRRVIYQAYNAQQGALWS